MLQNISGKWRRSVNADTAMPSLILVEKPASSNVNSLMPGCYPTTGGEGNGAPTVCLLMEVAELKYLHCRGEANQGARAVSPKYCTA